MSDDLKRIFVNYRNFEAADLEAFKKLDPTPEDNALTAEDWQKIPAIHYQDLYDIIGKYQEITRLSRFSHPYLLLVPDGRTLLLSAQHYTVTGEAPVEFSVMRDPYGNNVGIFTHTPTPSLFCLPALSGDNSGSDFLSPGFNRFPVEFTDHLDGNETIAARIVPNRFGKEPADFFPPTRKKLMLYVAPEGTKTRLIITDGEGITDPANQFFIRYEDTIIKLSRRNLNEFDPLHVVSSVLLPQGVRSFDLVTVDHAGNQKTDRYRIVATKKGLFLEDMDEQNMEQIRMYQIAVASLVAGGYRVVDSGEIPPWGVSENPNTLLQTETGIKLYSRPELYRDNTIRLSPFSIKELTLGKKRYVRPDETYRTVFVEQSKTHYLVVRNWLNGDVVFEVEMGNLDSISPDKMVECYQNLKPMVAEAIEYYRDRHGMATGQEFSEEMVKAKDHFYPLLLEKAPGNSNIQPSIPKILLDAEFSFSIVDTMRDTSLPLAWGTEDKPLVYSVTGHDLQKKPFSTRGEITRLKIRLSHSIEVGLLQRIFQSRPKPFRDPYGNEFIVSDEFITNEDQILQTTTITILLLRKRSRKPVDDRQEEYLPVSVDLSPWLPQAGLIKNVALQVMQNPQAFIGPEGVYAVYSHFKGKRWRQIGYSLSKIEKELVEIENQFGLKLGTAIDSVLFQDSSEVNASVQYGDLRTVRINREMLDTIGNWHGVTRHEASHVLDSHFGISADPRWIDHYNKTGKDNPHFFLFLVERHFLPTNGGHPQDNPDEFFASVISSLAHPDILAYLEQRAKLKPDRQYVVTYLKTLECLQGVLKEKLPPQAPILKDLEDLCNKVTLLLDKK